MKVPNINNIQIRPTDKKIKQAKKLLKDFGLISEPKQLKTKKGGFIA